MPYNPNQLGMQTLRQYAGRMTPQELRLQHLLSQPVPTGLGSGIAQGMEQYQAENEARLAQQDQLAMTNALEFVSSIPDDGNNFQIKQSLLQELIGLTGQGGKRKGTGGKSGLGPKLLELFKMQPSGQAGGIGGQIEQVMKGYLPQQGGIETGSFAVGQTPESVGMGATVNNKPDNSGRLDLGTVGQSVKPFTGQVYFDAENKAYTISQDTRTGEPVINYVPVRGLRSEKQVIAQEKEESKEQMAQRNQQRKQELIVMRQNSKMVQAALMNKGMFAEEFYQLPIEEQHAALKEVMFDAARKGDLETQKTIASIESLRAGSQLKTMQSNQTVASGGVTAGTAVADLARVESVARGIQKDFDNSYSTAKSLQGYIKEYEKRFPDENSRKMNALMDAAGANRYERAKIELEKDKAKMKQFAERAKSDDMGKYFESGEADGLPTLRFKGIGRTPGTLNNREKSNADATGAAIEKSQSSSGIRQLPQAKNGKQLVAIDSDWFQAKGVKPEELTVGTEIVDSKTKVTYIYKGEKKTNGKVEYILEVK